MKKYLMMWSAMLMAVITASSCSEQNELIEENSNYRTLTIVATQGADTQSRVNYEQDGNNLCLTWSEDDKIIVKENIFDMLGGGSGPIEFSLAEGANTNRGTFTYSGNVPDSWVNGEAELIAYYKAGNNIETFHGLMMRYPETFTQIANNDMTHLSAYNHMSTEPFHYSENKLPELYFKQLGAIMKLELDGLGGKTIKSLKMASGDKVFLWNIDIWGEEHISCQTEEYVNIRLGENGNGITLGETEKLTAYLMLGVNATAASPNGKDIKLYAFDNEDVIYDADIKGGTLEAGKLYTLNKTMSEKIFWQGEGTQAAPYKISNVKELFALKEWMDLLGKGTDNLHFQLQQSIDMNNSWICLEAVFNGVFDGNGKTISNLKYDSGSNAYIFRYLSNNSTIKNLTISGSITNVSSNTGGIAQFNYGTIIGCTNLVDIQGQYSVGGIVDTNFGNVIACVNKGNLIISDYTVGGIVAQQGGGRVIGCYNSGTIERAGADNPDDKVGGVISDLYGNSSVIACYNTGELIGYAPGNISGKVKEKVSSTFNNCYWSGNAYGAIGSGGSSDATLENCNVVTDWSAVVDAMNTALENAGVSYQYILNEDEATKGSEPLLLKIKE